MLTKAEKQKAISSKHCEDKIIKLFKLNQVISELATQGRMERILNCFQLHLKGPSIFNRMQKYRTTLDYINILNRPIDTITVSHCWS